MNSLLEAYPTSVEDQLAAMISVAILGERQGVTLHHANLAPASCRHWWSFCSILIMIIIRPMASTHAASGKAFAAVVSCCASSQFVKLQIYKDRVLLQD